MGYSFGWNSKKELVEYLLKPWGDKETHVTIEHTCTGNILWYVVEQTKETGEQEKYINCALLSGKDGDWGYKGMSASMHPFYYSCPLKYLEMVPEECAEWRAKVREYWQGKANARKKSAELTPGQNVTLPEGWTVRNFTLKEKRKQTWMAYGSDGRLYRLPLKAIQAAVIG